MVSGAFGRPSTVQGGVPLPVTMHDGTTTVFGDNRDGGVPLDVAGLGSAMLHIGSGHTGVVAFEASMEPDRGVWSPVVGYSISTDDQSPLLTTSGSGFFYISCPAALKVRARLVSITSGALRVVGGAHPASGMGLGSTTVTTGGGGASGETQILAEGSSGPVLVSSDTGDHNLDASIAASRRTVDAISATLATDGLTVHNTDDPSLPLVLAQRYVPFGISASGEIAAAVTSKKVRIIAAHFHASAALTVYLRTNGSGGTVIYSASGAPVSLAANGGFVLTPSVLGWCESGVGQNIYATISAGNLSGQLVVVDIP